MKVIQGNEDIYYCPSNGIDSVDCKTKYSFSQALQIGLANAIMTFFSFIGDMSPKIYVEV